MVQDVDSSLIASPNYQSAELERRTRALVQAGGPWLRFKDALERLFYLAELNTHPASGYVGSEALPDALPKRWARDRADYPVNPALAPYRRDYMPDDFDGDGTPALRLKLQGLRMVSHARDMLANGFGVIVEQGIAGPLAEEKAIDCEAVARDLLARFDKPYLDEALREQYRQLAARGEEVPINGPFYGEITRHHEQIQFLPRELGAWLKANASVVPASDQALFNRHMREYTAAYEEILDYVAYARGYINHMDGKSQSQEWRR